MKYYIIVLSLVILSSCGNSTKEEPRVDEEVDELYESEETKEIEFVEEGTEITIETILQKTRKIDLPLNYDEQYLDSPEKLKAMYIPCTEAERFYNPDFCEDSVGIIWVYEHETGPVVCYVSSALFPKGMSTYYVLAKYDNAHTLQDQIQLAAQYAVAVENPNGGTSAGVDFSTATVDTDFNVQVTYQGETTPAIIRIGADGMFEFIGKKELNVSKFAKLKLKKFTHNIDYISWEFEDKSGKEWNFAFQSQNLQEDSEFYYEFVEVEGQMIPEIKPKPHRVDKWYRVKYKWELQEMPLVGEVDTHRVIHDLIRLD